MQLSKTSQLLGKGIARYSVVLFFLGFGLVAERSAAPGDDSFARPASSRLS